MGDGPAGLSAARLQLTALDVHDLPPAPAAVIGAVDQHERFARTGLRNRLHSASVAAPERTISVEGGVDAALADKLIEIAGKCPVHRTLEAGAAAVTKVAS